jgi:molecular chaperone IbpA
VSIGFDRMLNALEAADRVEPFDKWPPYDIARTGEDDYRITVAVPGFSRDELTVTQEHDTLVVSGEKAGKEDAGRYLHHGIAGRVFQHRFELADHVTVTGAGLADGLLVIELKRELPEEMKPRRIAISAGGALPRVAADGIEAGQAAAWMSAQDATDRNTERTT